MTARSALIATTNEIFENINLRLSHDKLTRRYSTQSIYHTYALVFSTPTSHRQ